MFRKLLIVFVLLIGCLACSDPSLPTKIVLPSGVRDDLYGRRVVKLHIVEFDYENHHYVCIFGDSLCQQGSGLSCFRDEIRRK